jgi:acetyl esterase
VTDVERLARRRKLPGFIFDRLAEVSTTYLADVDAATALHMADPLVVLEQGETPHRPLPPFFIPCGTKDPLLDDTRRLGRALAALGVRAEVKIYEGEVHAFHAMVWRARAKQCWADIYRFLDDVLAQ